MSEKTRRIKIFDTTLRDGEQSPGCSMNIGEKLRMAEQLDRLGVDVIEAGFAIASPGDFQAVKSISGVVKNAVVASLARSLEKDIDVAWEAVREAAHPRIHVFLATSELHMRYKLKMTPEEVLERARTAVAYAKSKCADVEFSAEDASRSEPEFLCKVLEAAIEAGATTVNIPDTVGYAVPEDYATLIGYVVKNVRGIDKVDVSVHCHNDLGMATANSLAAVRAGASQIECTINGIGERAGNTALEEVVMALYTRRDYFDATCGVNTAEITKTSRLLTAITGVKVQPNKAIVGENAFAHESGIHQHGVLANKQTYEIMTPESVGLTENKMVLGKHSGKHALADRLKTLGITVSDEALGGIFDEFKKLADRQKSVSDRDIEALAHKQSTSVPESYKLDRFVVNVGNTITTTSAVRLVCPDGEKREAVTSSVFGPIDASYKAINELGGGDEFELVDFLIDSVTGGTDAQGAVTVKIRAGQNVFNGHAVSLDIVDAAVMAYVSVINNMLYEKKLVTGENQGAK